ncbi:enterotoxin A family protein [Bartonella schoenbuchensis]|nr:enterotoxin A family protein [Bartonella schoenbuchensis]
MPAGLPGFGSGYVVTITSQGFAMSWVNSDLNYNGYIYPIKATPHFIDVNASLGGYFPHLEEREGVDWCYSLWNQIIGWGRVSCEHVDPFILNLDTVSDYVQVFYHQVYNHNELVFLINIKLSKDTHSSNPLVVYRGRFIFLLNQRKNFEKNYCGKFNVLYFE